MHVGRLRTDPGDGCPAAIVEHVGNDNLRALGNESAGDHGTAAAGAAGHDRDLAVEPISRHARESRRARDASVDAPATVCRPRRRSGHDGAMSDEAVPVLRVMDAARAVAWYERLGYAKEWEHRFGQTFPAFVSIACDGGARLFVSEHLGDAQPGTLVDLRGADVDRVAAEFGADIVDQPCAREVALVDPDGDRVRVGTPSA